MANDDEDDLFEEEFDFVDEDDSEVEENSVEESSEVEEEKSTKPKRRSAKASNSKEGGKPNAKKSAAAKDNDTDDDSDGDTQEKAAEAEAEPEEADKPPGPPSDHVVHIYEYGNFKRVIQREFTDEDSIKFAEEYNRTSKSYSRRAVPVHRDEEPEPHL